MFGPPNPQVIPWDPGDSTRERAAGPHDLTDWKARAEKGERERDELVRQRDYEWDRRKKAQDRAIAAESALVEERRKAQRLEGELTRVAESMGDTVALLTLARRLWGELDRLKVAYSTNLAQHVAGPDPALLAAAAERFSIRTCPVCGEEAHTGTCVDAALASGNAPEMNQGAATPRPLADTGAIRLRELLQRARSGLSYEHWTENGRHAIGAEQGWSEEDCPYCSTDPDAASGERPAGPPEIQEDTQSQAPAARSLEET